MKYLIIPDIHLKLDIVKHILEQYESCVDKVIFLGDYFDDFGDTIKMNSYMAKWLKESIYKENRIHLMGNHEMGYRYSKNIYTRCSGWSNEKSIEINKILTKDDWDKFEYLYYLPECNFLFSHGGLSNGIFCHPILGFDLLKIKESLDFSKEKLGLPGTNLPPEFGIGYCRGGRQNEGGVTWCDFERDFVPIEGINQVVGHTPNTVYRKLEIKYSVNYCLDTNLNHIAILENQNLNIIKISK